MGDSMKLEYGDMWQIFNITDFFIFTGNSVITRYGRLVMGAGIALEVKEKIKGIDSVLGKKIAKNREYNFIYVSPKETSIYNTNIGVFQVKYHFKYKAELNLVKRATKKLSEVALAFPDKRFDMNFPAIGYGGLKINEIMPIIKLLPNNVHIWRKDKI